MKILLKMRLSWFFFTFLVTYFLIAFLFDDYTFTPAAIALFSVNSFLYGFSISPVLAGQKARIDELQKSIRSEANALFDIAIKTKKLQGKTRNHIQELLEDYLAASLRQKKPGEGEKEYEALINYCLRYDADKDSQEKVDKILTSLVTNQQNRSLLAMHLGNKVYSNEWWVMLVLFSITVGFILSINAGDTLVINCIKALLCTGLSMLMLTLLKLSTLTHKKARRIWDPLDKLKTSHFYRID